MKHLHWWTLIIGYLIGSFFSITAAFGLVTGAFGQKKQAVPAAA